MALDLASLEYGNGPPLVILHGLFGSARNWNTLLRQFGATRQAIALDLRNHGASPWAEAMDYPAMAGDVAATIERRGLAPVSIVGHSMGGKVAMLLSLERPDLVERLVVVDIAPVHYRHSFRGYVQAMQAIDLTRVSRRGEVEAQLAGTVAEPGIRAFLLQNLVAENGCYRWRINLDAIAAHMEAITGFPDVPPGRHFAGPTLFLAGAKSDYVRREHEEAIARLFPRARLETIADAGHWVHAEQPARFAARVQAFLDEPAGRA